MPSSLQSLISQALAGEVGAVARLITILEEQGPAASEVLGALRPRTGRAQTVGITGAPGAGKSSLINAYIGVLRAANRRVAVLAIDPSSPRTGGALLGDRVRMGSHTLDAGVFIRSVSTRGHLGGLNLHARSAIDILDAAGWDVILVETVGVGQCETDVADCVHVNVMVLAPSMGDEIQAMKAGILETADILVVNKSDLPHANEAVKALESMLRLREPGSGEVPIVRTIATEGFGVTQLSDAVNRCAAHARSVKRDSRQQVSDLVAAGAARKVLHAVRSLHSPSLDALFESVCRGDAQLEDAIRRAICEVAASLDPDAKRH